MRAREERAVAMASFLRPLARLSFYAAVVSSLCLPLLRNVEATGQREFDYFLLALQWPGTICQSTRHCCSSNACCRSSGLPEFTIHGLWADYNDGTWPSCCSHDEFDLNKVKSLLPTMEKYWPSLYCSSPSLCFGGKGLFWAHEWGKHGTCSYPVIQDEYSYFSKALDLYLKYNVTEVLTDAGILATNGKKYPLGDIVAIIKNAFGATPLLVCKHGSLEELRLCFHKDFTPRDCGSEAAAVLNDLSNSKSSCPRKISLPTYTPLGLGDTGGLTDESTAFTEA